MGIRSEPFADELGVTRLPACLAHDFERLPTTLNGVREIGKVARELCSRDTFHLIRLLD